MSTIPGFFNPVQLPFLHFAQTWEQFDLNKGSIPPGRAQENGLSQFISCVQGLEYGLIESLGIDHTQYRLIALSAKGPADYRDWAEYELRDVGWWQDSLRAPVVLGDLYKVSAPLVYLRRYAANTTMRAEEGSEVRFKRILGELQTNLYQLTDLARASEDRRGDPDLNMLSYFFGAEARDLFQIHSAEQSAAIYAGTPVGAVLPELPPAQV